MLTNFQKPRYNNNSEASFPLALQPHSLYIGPHPKVIRFHREFQLVFRLLLIGTRLKVTHIYRHFQLAIPPPL